MSEPRAWELYLPYYLKAAESELRRLSPLKSVRILPEDGPLLIFNRVPVSLVFENREPLAEARRWLPVLRHLARVLVENLVLSTAYDGWPGPKVLDLMSQEAPISGLLISGRNLSLPEGSLRLTDNVYFLPAFMKKTLRFLKENWRVGKKFVSVGVSLEGSRNLNTVLARLEWARLFGFTFLSPKAEAQLQPVFENFGAVKRLLRNKGKLILVKLSRPPKGIKGVSLGDLLLLKSPKGLEDLLGTSSGLCAGIYEGNFKGPALALVYAAYEHARRLGGGSVRFEPFSYHVLGDLYADWGDMGAALWAYREAEKGTLQPAYLFNSRGLLLKALGLYEEAEKAFRRALSLAPEDPLINFNLGTLLLENRDSEALTYLRSAFRLSPARVLFAETLAEALSQAGRKEEALELLLGRSQLTLKGRALLGRLLYEAGRFEEAFECLKAVSREREAPAEALAYLALLYQRKGESEAAFVLAREALRRGGSRISEILDQKEAP